MSTTKLIKWGNGQGFRITKEMMENGNLQLGDEFEVSVKDCVITLTPSNFHVISPLDFDKLFADYDGPQPTDDYIPAGEEIR
ncbi:hypothetical protein PT282_01055 [Bifidobacterium sp. ESL0763]|uniref:AbrB/MazE/SpoVT family DNA-binding domain-containing protein n=1 Tax=Bifidobacterium sp. ESL0763 TaxID=2983227 RepID=UPI0023F8F4D8|nr:hypothetical protein [Bifidobacterium sp. ESL0763]MDF7663271.1 hypothetical protein [Bifidobacterium sp. ESL0763]